MRARRRQWLEPAVYATALLLAAFVAWQLWRRRPPRSVPEPAPTVAPATPRPPALSVARRVRREVRPAPQVELGVTAMPPVRVNRVRPRKPRETVPPPSRP